TPTILAGNSFTGPIDVVYGYFTPESCDQGDDMQMLMRCRNIISKRYYICISNKRIRKLIPDDIPLIFETIKEYLLKKETIISMQYNFHEEFRHPLDILGFNYIDNTFDENDTYLDSFINFIRQNVIKQREYL